MVMLPKLSETNVDAILANAGGGVNIPEGEYKAVIVSSELKSTTKGGQALNLKFVITEGPHANVELVERLNLINDSAAAVKIASETLARIAKASGLANLPQDSIALHNKPMVIKVKTEPAKPYIDKDGREQPGSPRSVIDSRGYAMVPGVGVNPATAAAAYKATTDKMPWQ